MLFLFIVINKNKMAALLIVPFLESIGVSSLIGTAAAEVVVGESVAANALGQIGQGLIASEIAKPIDKNLIGPIEEKLNDYFDTSIAVLGQDPKFFLKKEIERQELVKKQSSNKTPNNSPINSPIDSPIDFPSTAREIARHVIDTSVSLANNKPLDTNNSLFQKVSNFLKGVKEPNTEEYKKIKSVYNGRNINQYSFSQKKNEITGLIEVSGKNEIGQILTLPQTTGRVLPSVPGTIFMGPLSINNRVPIGCAPNGLNGDTRTFGGEVFRIEDAFSFFHDYSWRNSNFNKIGDLQFIARLHTALEDSRVLPQNIQLVKATIIYFSNISLTLSMFVQQPNEDIFAHLKIIPQESLEYIPMRNEFYKTMNEELMSYSKTNGLHSKGSKNNYLINLINNLEYQ